MPLRGMEATGPMMSSWRDAAQESTCYLVLGGPAAQAHITCIPLTHFSCSLQGLPSWPLPGPVLPSRLH